MLMLFILIKVIKGAIGAVARDCHGKFMIASCMEIHSVADPFMAETYVLRDGFSLAQHIGGNKFIIQSDNSKLIETMLDGGFRQHLRRQFAFFFLIP
jgi:hypothetical protein